MIKRFEYWFRHRILLWGVARLIDEYYGDEVCWARLVGWALYDSSLDQLSYCFSTKACREDMARSFAGVCCYCGGIQGIMPTISFQFMLTGKRWPITNTTAPGAITTLKIWTCGQTLTKSHAAHSAIIRFKQNPIQMRIYMIRLRRNTYDRSSLWPRTSMVDTLNAMRSKSNKRTIH